MINAIVNGLFNLVISMFNAILSPVVSAVTSLFPSVGLYFGYINTFVGYMCTYASLAIDLLRIPRACFVMLFDYYIVLYSIFTLTIVVKFVLNIYNKLKF